MIDQATIDRIMDAAQIVDVVSEFVTLRKRGVNYIGLCPFHDEKTPSFSVSQSKGLCKCFSCGKGGNAVHFIMEHEQMTYYEALKYLAKKYNIEVKERELTSEEKQAQTERESMFIVNNFAKDYFKDKLFNSQEGKNIGLNYFRQRGFRDDIIEKFELGYCTESKDAMSMSALEKGYRAEFLVKTGLAYENDNKQLRDRFWGRVIFPVHTLSGKVVAFGGRVLNSETKGVKVKYVNSPESEIYHKSNELYGIYFAKQAMVKADRCYLVEGYTDVISMYQAGVQNVVSSSGTALTSAQIRLIHRFTNNITVLYDGDLAGIKASIRGIDMLLEEGMNVKVCLLPDGDDPDSFAQKHSGEDFRIFIEQNQKDFIQFKTDLLLEEAGKDPIKKAELITNIVKSISVIPEDIVRDVYVKQCSEQLNVGEKLLVNEVAKLREEKRNKARQQKQGETTSKESTVSSEGVEQQEERSADSSFDSDTSKFATDKSNAFRKHELMIVRYIVKFGGHIILNNVDEQTGSEEYITVAEFIKYELMNDDITFHTPIHNEILDDAFSRCVEAKKSCCDTSTGKLGDNIHVVFNTEKYFTNHINGDISMLSANVISSKYHLSKYHSKTQKILKEEDRLLEILKNLLFSYKYAIIEDDMNTLLLKLQKKDLSASECDNLMKEFTMLQRVKASMAKMLGDRVVLK
ncbi:MAG: DNA primase [Bacteroides sp.]|nr:DNA primase [Bacteroides sp.]